MMLTLPCMAPKLQTLQRLGCWEGLWEVLGIQKVWQVWGWEVLGRGRFGKGRLWVAGEGAARWGQLGWWQGGRKRGLLLLLT